MWQDHTVRMDAYIDANISVIPIQDPEEMSPALLALDVLLTSKWEELRHHISNALWKL